MSESLATILVLAAEGGGAAPEEGGSFLVTPGFGLTMFLLAKLAFPRIGEALDRRQRAIEESIDTAERTRREADKLLAEYRERLAAARGQADDIVARARKTGEAAENELIADAKSKREEMMEQTRRD